MRLRRSWVFQARSGMRLLAKQDFCDGAIAVAFDPRHRARGEQAPGAGVAAQKARETAVPGDRPLRVRHSRCAACDANLEIARRVVVRPHSDAPQLEVPSATRDASFHPTAARHASRLTLAAARRASVWSDRDSYATERQSTNELPPAARSAEPLAPRTRSAQSKDWSGVSCEKTSPHRCRNFSSLSAPATRDSAASDSLLDNSGLRRRHSQAKSGASASLSSCIGLRRSPIEFRHSYYFPHA